MTWPTALRRFITMAQHKLLVLWVLALILSAMVPVLLLKGYWLDAARAVIVAAHAFVARRVMRWILRKTEEDEARWAEEDRVKEAAQRLRDEAEDQAGVG